jgi:F0F1-type ATP synthase membrane subunit b/b'
MGFNPISAIQNVQRNVTNTFQGAQKNLSNTVQAAQKNISNASNSLQRNVGNTLQGAQKNVVNTVRSTQSSVSNTAKNVQRNLDSTVKGAQKNVSNTVQAAQKKISNASNSLQRNVGNTLQGAQKNVANTVRSAQTNVANTAKNVQRNLDSTVKGAQKNLSNTVQTAQKNVANTVKDIQRNVGGTVKTVQKSVDNTVNSVNQTLKPVVNEAKSRIDQAKKLAGSPYQPKVDATNPAKPKADVSVAYAQNSKREGFKVTVPDWLKGAVDASGKVDQFVGTLTGNKQMVEAGNAQRDLATQKDAAKGAELEVGLKTKKKFDGKGKGFVPELAVGVKGEFVNVKGASANASIEKGEGRVNAYNANENILNRATNAAGNFFGNVMPKASLSTEVKGVAGWFAGAKVKPTEAFAGGEINAKIDPNLKAGVSVNLPFNLGRVNFGGGVAATAEAKLKAGLQTKPTPISPELETSIEAGATATYSATKPGKQNFSDLNAAGYKSNTAAAKGIQSQFQVSDTDKPSMVTVNASNNNKFFVGPANRDRGTVYVSGNNGKLDQSSNIIDKTMSGSYVRVADQARWLNNIGKQNAGNQNSVFSKVTSQDLELLNPEKVKKIMVNGKEESVISTENINTGIYRDTNGAINRAAVVDMGDGKTVTLSK